MTTRETADHLRKQVGEDTFSRIYYIGHDEGESSVLADLDFALTDGPLNLPDMAKTVSPWELCAALAEILTEEQKARLAKALS